MRKTTNGDYSKENLLRGLQLVIIHKKQIRSTAKELDLNYETLSRYCKQFSFEQLTDENFSLPVIGYSKNKTILSMKMEEDLLNYIIRASEIYFGLSPLEIRRLAYQIAIAN